MRYTIFLFLLLPAFLWGQYPNNPRKLRLGTQTTGAGLTYIQSGAPSHTPANDDDAWMVLDTTNNALYYYDEAAGAWENILDDVVRDTVFRITSVPDTSTIVPLQGDLFINATADTLGAYDPVLGWQLFVGGDGNGIYSGSGTLPSSITVTGSGNNMDFGDGSLGDIPSLQFWPDAFEVFTYGSGTGMELFIEPNFFQVGGWNTSNDFSKIEFQGDTLLFKQGAGGFTVDDQFGMVDGSFLISGTGPSYGYKFPRGASPSTTLNDTTVMAWRGTGSAAEAVGFVPYGGVGSGSSTVDHDTSAYFHRRLTFGTDYTLPSAVLDTADLISIYAGAQTGTSITITLPTLSDTTYDGKIIYVMGSGTENGDIMRITSPDSTDILVQGCGAGSVTGPDTITTSYRVLYQYIISNGRYYRTCQRANVNSITSVSDTTNIDAHQGDMFVNSTADTLGLYSGTGWVLFYGGGGGTSIFKQENTSTAATTGSTNNYHQGRIGIGDFSVSTIPAQLTIYDTTNARLRLSDVASTDTAATAYIEYYRGVTDSQLGLVGYTNNTDADLYVTNKLTGGGVTIQTNSTDFFRVAANGQMQLPGYGDTTYTGTAVKYLAVTDGGDVIESDADTGPPVVSVDTVSTSKILNFSSNHRGIFNLDFSGVVDEVRLTFSNPVNGGEYIIWTEGCSNDTITFPANALTLDRDSMKSRLCTSAERLDFFYDGTNYIFRDSIWAEVTPVGSVFSPSDYGSLLVWLAADSLSLTNGDAVSSWGDVSGNGYNAIQATGADQPIYIDTLSGTSSAAVRFDGTSDFLAIADAAGISSLNEVTIFVALRMEDTITANQPIIAKGVGDTGNREFQASYASAGNVQMFVYDESATDSDLHLTSNGAVTKSSFHTLKFTHTNTGNEVGAYIDGSGGVSASIITIEDRTAPMRIGRNQSITPVFLNAYIGEIIIYNTLLTPAQISNVETYLSNKY